MKTIYFLDWLSQESGFSVPQLVEAMKPENQGWENNHFKYKSVNEFFEKYDPIKYVYYIFNWKNLFF